MKKGELEQSWGAKVFCLQTPITEKKGGGELKLPIFFFFFYVCFGVPIFHLLAARGYYQKDDSECTK